MERFIPLLLFTSVLGTTNAESYDKTKDAELAIKKFSLQVRRCCGNEHILNAGKTVNAAGKSNELLRCENNGAISNTANVTLDYNPGECMDGKFQSFYFGDEKSKFNIPYIKLDSSTDEILVKN